MIRKIKYFLILSSLFAIVSVSETSAQWSIMKSDADSLMLKGSYYIYNVQFDSASACFKEFQRRYPDEPAGYFLEAMIDWWQITIHRETNRFDKGFLRKIDKVVDICDGILEENEHDLNAHFFKGGALGYRGRYHAVRENWFSAASDGKTGFDILYKCYEVAPNNHDIMLGTGIYNYFADAIPDKYPFIKPLTLFLPKGDKKIGLLQLHASAKMARYTSVEAKVVLLQLYYSFEKNYRKALPIVEELHNAYPSNPYFHRYLGRCYVTTSNQAKWEATWREVVKRCIRKEKGYERVTAREGLYYIGLSLLYKKDYRTALKYFKKCEEASSFVDDDPSGFRVNANLYLGKIYDKLGKRKYAKRKYEKVLDWDDYKGSHNAAEKYLKKAFGK
ncbi:MAG: hypothetical protein PF588_05070 [Candidatus Kapabacteria bacterium]|jgi:tetratricopeptide (TPR) repeat protein|nr:hypothetical protein [Candidatus Kapabacteria bacterium]